MLLYKTLWDLSQTSSWQKNIALPQIPASLFAVLKEWWFVISQQIAQKSYRGADSNDILPKGWSVALRFPWRQISMKSLIKQQGSQDVTNNKGAFAFFFFAFFPMPWKYLTPVGIYSLMSDISILGTPILDVVYLLAHIYLLAMTYSQTCSNGHL